MDRLPGASSLSAASGVHSLRSKRTLTMVSAAFLPQYAAVDEVGQAIRSHAAAGRQSKAEQHTVENIALSGTIRPRHHGETLLKRDAHCPTEGLEVRQTNLIDVDHQDSGEADTPRYRSCANAQGGLACAVPCPRSGWC